MELPAQQVARTIADGLRVRRLGDAPFEHVRAFVDDIVTVGEEEIREAMRRLALHVRLVAEPSGAVAFAAHLFRRDELPKTRLNVAVVSGGNVEPALLAEVLAEETPERDQRVITYKDTHHRPGPGPPDAAEG